MVHRRRWGRRAALLTAAVVTVLAAPAAAHAYTFVGTQTGFWWSKDTVVQFDPGEVWTVSDYNDTTSLSGIGGSLALGSLHEGNWNLETGLVTDPTQIFSFGLDFTPPTSGDLVCRIGLSGWCISGFQIQPAPTDPQAAGIDHVSGLDHSEYSVDGGPWTTFDPNAYTDVEGEHQIRWRAVDAAGNVEAYHTADVKMDTVPPTVAARLAGPLGANGWYTGPVTVTLVPSDAGPGIYSLDYDVFDFSNEIESPTGPYTAPFVVSTEGREFVQGRVEDNAGEASGFTQEVDIDSTPPAASLDVLSGPPDPGFAPDWYKDFVEVRLNAQDVQPEDGHIESGIDHASISWPSVVGARNFTNITPGSLVDITGATGPTTVTYGATDRAGNTSAPQTQTFDIDGNPPSTHYTYSGATFDAATGWWIGGPVTVTAVGTDPGESGVLNVDACDSRFSFCQNWFGSTYQYVPVDDETVNLSATSTDKVGHVESSSNPLTVKDDADPPTGTLVVSGIEGSNGWYRSPITVKIQNAADVGSGLAANPFSYQIFGSTPTSFDGTYVDTNEGDTAFRAAISDVAGNVTHLPQQDLRIDTRPPEITLQGFESQGSGGWDRYAEIDGLYATDPFPGSGLASQGSFSLDGGPFVPLDQLPGYDFGDDDFPVPDGTHTIFYRASDNAGNVSLESRTYTVDSTPPDLTCTATSPTTWPTDGSMVPVSVDVSVSDALSGASAAGATLDNVSSNVDWDAQAADEATGWDTGTGDTAGEVAALPGRTYTLTYEAQDVAGNQGFCQLQVTVPGAPGPAIMAGDLTLPDGAPLQIDVRRDASGVIGGAGVGYGDRHSTGLDDVEILGHNGYVHGTLDDGAGFTLLLHDGSPDELRLIDDDGVDTGWVTPASGDLLVTQDTTPPVLTLPDSPVTTDATSPAGATVSYTVTAKDDFDPSPTVACTPASGSLFPVGSTTVRCTATDASGNESHGSFTVHVAGAAEQAADLRTWIVQRQIGPGTSLAAKLHTPLQCDDLQALANEVRAQTGKKITRQDAATIAGDLARIENALGC